MTEISDEPRVLTYRARLLAQDGPGVRPCVTATGSWLGCSWCNLGCILAPGGLPRMKTVAVVRELVELADESLEQLQEQEAKPKKRQVNWWRVGPQAGRKRVVS